MNIRRVPRLVMLVVLAQDVRMIMLAGKSF
jgi:hypothetical protein